MSELRAGVIGLGVGEQHIAGYRAAGCTVAAICDIDPTRLADVAARHPGVEATSEPEGIIADPAIDVVSVASYDDAHHAQVVAALEAGKHVFVEKPLCLHREEAEEIWSLLRRRSDLVLSANLPLRASPRFLRARALVSSGELGRLFHSEVAYRYGRPWKLTDGWRGRLPFYSVVLGGAIHMIDLLLWITGARVESVKAASNRIATAAGGFRFDDLVVATARMSDGSVATITTDFGSRHPHFHELKLFGTRASFVNRLGEGIIYRGYDDDPRAEPVADEYPGVSKHALLPGFVEAIRSSSEPPVSASELFEVMAACFAIEEAKDRDEAVNVRRFS